MFSSVKAVFSAISSYPYFKFFQPRHSDANLNETSLPAITYSTDAVGISAPIKTHSLIDSEINEHYKESDGKKIFDNAEEKVKEDKTVYDKPFFTSISEIFQKFCTINSEKSNSTNLENIDSTPKAIEFEYNKNEENLGHSEHTLTCSNTFENSDKDSATNSWEIVASDSERSFVQFDCAENELKRKRSCTSIRNYKRLKVQDLYPGTSNKIQNYSFDYISLKKPLISERQARQTNHAKPTSRKHAINLPFNYYYKYRANNNKRKLKSNRRLKQSISREEAMARKNLTIRSTSNKTFRAGVNSTNLNTKVPRNITTNSVDDFSLKKPLILKRPVRQAPQTEIHRNNLAIGKSLSNYKHKTSCKINKKSVSVPNNTKCRKSLLESGKMAKYIEKAQNNSQRKTKHTAEGRKVSIPERCTTHVINACPQKCLHLELLNGINTCQFCKNVTNVDALASRQDENEFLNEAEVVGVFQYQTMPVTESRYPVQTTTISSCPERSLLWEFHNYYGTRRSCR